MMALWHAESSSFYFVITCFQGVQGQVTRYLPPPFILTRTLWGRWGGERMWSSVMSNAHPIGSSRKKWQLGCGLGVYVRQRERQTIGQAIVGLSRGQWVFGPYFRAHRPRWSYEGKGKSCLLFGARRTRLPLGPFDAWVQLGNEKAICSAPTRWISPTGSIQRRASSVERIVWKTMEGHKS